MLEVLKELCQLLQEEKGNGIVKIGSDHGTEFENSKLHEFCASEGINHDFSSLITPHQNGVVKRKNTTLQESSRVMLYTKKHPYYCLSKFMNTTFHIHNRVTIRSRTKETLYELWKGRKPNVVYLYVF